MAGQRAPHQKLAYALIFLLAMREVTAARDSFQAQSVAAAVGSGLRAADAENARRDAVTDSGEFWVRTMWARGEADSLTWKSGLISFRFADGVGREPSKYLEVTGMDSKYRIMPDAVVLNQNIEGMAVLGIIGWQAYDASKRQWGESQYSKKKSLFLRTELNAWVGMTKDTFLGPNAGLRAYQAPKEKTEEKAKFYYLNEKGVQKSVDADDIMMHTPRHEQMSLQVPGQAATVLARPDRELMALIDAMLGEASCMGKDSKCAFRCFYDVEHEVCGPVAFCQPVASGAASHVLAPFGDQQKCAAVGGRTHDVADQVLASSGMASLKTKALDVVDRLAASEAVTWSSSGRSSLKASVALWMEAADLLNVFETLPTRLTPESGNFPLAARRASDTDMKHWRRRPDKLTISQYNAAASAPISSVRGTTDYSVPARLHSELVDFVIKRPSILMSYVKSETQEKCLLLDKTAADRAQTETFVKYFLKVPGHNSEDLRSVSLGLPEHCQEYLAGIDGSDVESLSQDAAAGEEALGSEHSSFAEIKSVRLSRALSDASLLEMGADASSEESEAVRQRFVIIASIIVGLV
ncbi:unnamed protein product, partial [Effrenium voratum]